MKKIIIILTAALTLTAVGCNKENTAIENNDNRITELVASIEGRTPDTRLSYTKKDNGGLKFEWEHGENIYVFPAKIYNETDAADAIIPVEFYYDSTTGTFRTTIDGTYIVAGKEYFAVTGHMQASSKFNQGEIKAAMRHANTSIAEVGEMPLVSDIFTAVADKSPEELNDEQVKTNTNTVLNFHHTCGVIGFRGAGVGTINMLTIHATEGEYLYGNFDVTFDAEGKVENITKVQVSDGTLYHRINTPDELDLKIGYQNAPGYTDVDSQDQQCFLVYIPVLPGTYTNVEFWYNDKTQLFDNYILNSNGEIPQITVERGKVHTNPVRIAGFNG